jgi:8-oxo-dGTP pyrophosphatase MutT (NUDIX family)
MALLQACRMSVLDVLRAALEDMPPRDGLPGPPAHASVCVVVAGPTSAPSICLIRRARWPSDPWSEHIALPGGGRVGDEDAADTALRELREEVGLVLPPEIELTRLPQLHIRLAGRERLLLLDALVCYLGEAIPAVHAGPEIDLVFWMPIATLWDLGNATHNVLDDGDTLVYPAIRIPQGLIFGITLRVLVLLSDQLGIPLPMLEEIPLLRDANERCART